MWGREEGSSSSPFNSKQKVLNQIFGIRAKAKWKKEILFFVKLKEINDENTWWRLRMAATFLSNTSLGEMVFFSTSVITQSSLDWYIKPYLGSYSFVCLNIRQSVVLVWFLISKTPITFLWRKYFYVYKSVIHKHIVT
jgi:hypothetical protein